MYANASPHASATPPVSHALEQPGLGAPAHHAPQQQPHPGSGIASGVPGGAAMTAQEPQFQRSALHTSGAQFMTGAYQPSGDAMIDRMIALEAACKRFGSPI